MDLKEFLTLERRQLQTERRRLSAATTNKKNNKNSERVQQCPAALVLQTSDFVPGRCKHLASPRTIAESKCNEPNLTPSSLATDYVNTECPTANDTGVPQDTIVLDDELHLDLRGVQCGEDEEERTPLLKSNKERVRQRELLVGSARNYKSPNVSPRSQPRPLSENRLPIRRHKRDDMEQWVTDTFYSYFPGFNNENQKRQNYLRERQRENQQNFLRHQMLHQPTQKHAKQVRSNTQATAARPISSSSNANTSTTTTTATASTTDKTDLELIVNSNPNYVPPKIRPGTTRHKLLQDLGHVQLSNIVTGDGIMERNLRSAELETARKRDYQNDLMQQIQEKQRAIEKLKEKERKQEEALTRRLEAQLKAIQLEEQLERERMRAEKARIDSDQNRVMREQLLAKLEKDAQLLNGKPINKNPIAMAANSSDRNNNGNSNAADDSSNKVYKYFSNSAHHEYRRGQPLPPAVQLEFEIPEMAKIERECFHLCDKICPLCDEPLKSYESCCLRCQRKLALKMKQRRPKNPEKKTGQQNETDSNTEQQVYEDNVEIEDGEEEDDNHFCHSSYALVCLKCERLYALCTTCLAKSDVCRACQRERNVCMKCRRTLCSFCLEEIACGRDVERTHINEQPESDRESQKQKKQNAFRVLELNYGKPATPDTQDQPPAVEDSSPPPYSINIPRNSIFHADYNKNSSVKSFVDAQQLPSSSANTSFELDSADEQAMERVRRQTDARLSRYLQNYGDLAGSKPQVRSKSESRNRGTQTTPQTTGRRDVVLHESPMQNLSMPLLREMPRMTRHDAEASMPITESQRRMENLKKRWEVPAVQKFSVTSSSPKILTQVGAIRKQLQAERFFDNVPDGGDDDDDEY